VFVPCTSRAIVCLLALLSHECACLSIVRPYCCDQRRLYLASIGRGPGSDRAGAQACIQLAQNLRLLDNMYNDLLAKSSITFRNFYRSVGAVHGLR